MGYLHNAITRAFTRKIDNMLELANIPENKDDIGFIIDDKTLTAASNFCKNNDITCALPEQNDASPLAQSLAAIRAKQAGKVLAFVEPMKESNG
jgi:hypothetical protein